MPDAPDPDTEMVRLRQVIDRSVEKMRLDIDRQVEAEVARSSGYGPGLRAGLLVGLGCVLALAAVFAWAMNIS